MGEVNDKPGNHIIDGNRDIDINNLIRTMALESSEKGAGAIVIFIGFVKGVVNGVKVHELEYTAYKPYANKRINEIIENVLKDPEVIDIKVYHKVGNLKPGETTLYVAVSATTRGKAFEVAREVVERIKHEVPIYKLEKRDDGKYWVISDGRRIKARSI